MSAEATTTFPSREAIREAVLGYVNGLERGDFDAVADLFSEDAFYSHPPYDPNSPKRAEVRGREALRALLKGKRGSRTWFHEIQSFHVADDRCLIEGVVRESEGGPLRSSFAGAGTFNAQGEITRWVAYRSVPAIGESLDETS
ncbi:nuclear transport factor 2 family protein [Arthrobacter sp. I2-34]|uniref:Nuclear transport factor 2 family protein n=1 Tax=Arthrobacter hankyongi TaxID=2904801 RepID=A0ABS9L3R9_9MICC|nr:nuclear transport factor 2 family protein [Arthrobacter hankyongi]MCG2621310.1 nuclear transport factor 2 family protein [Arthrobacter hankyongi]